MDDILSRTIDELERTGRFSELKGFRQHGRHSVYDHCVNVARESLHIADKLGLKVDRKSLVRGALLHDYFLYDWHEPDPKRPNHAFHHARMAWENARRDYALNPTEEDIIRHHMFPVVPVPPRTTEGWIVNAADKACALKETMSRDAPNHENAQDQQED